MVKKKNNKLLIAIIILSVIIISLNTNNYLSRETIIGNNIPASAMQIDTDQPSQSNCHLSGFDGFDDTYEKDIGVLAVPLNNAVLNGPITNAAIHLHVDELMDDHNNGDGNLRISLVKSNGYSNCDDCMDYNQYINCEGSSVVIFDDYINEQEYEDEDIEYVLNSQAKLLLEQSINEGLEYVFFKIEPTADNDGWAEFDYYGDGSSTSSRRPYLTFDSATCNPSDPCCDNNGELRPNAYSSTCGSCKSCNGVSSQCVNTPQGYDYGNDCDSTNTCLSICTMKQEGSSCDGSGSCEVTIANAYQGLLCIGSTWANPSPTAYSKIDPQPTSCSEPNSPNSGNGDLLTNYYACDGNGGVNGPVAGQITTSINGCCYESGSLALEVSNGDSNYDLYDFGTGDSYKTDYCNNGVIIDCEDDNDCEQGFSCDNGACEQLECVTNNDCSGTAICDNNQCLAVGCVTNNDCSLGVCLPGNTCGCTQNVDCGVNAICNSGVCEQVQCTLNNQCSQGICLQDNTCGCNQDSECGVSEVCNNNQCLAVDCVTDGQCSSTEVCLGNICQPADCFTNNDCSQGVCLGSHTCGCNHDSECGSYSVCENYVCQAVECTTDSQCVSGSCNNNVCEETINIVNNVNSENETIINTRVNNNLVNYITKFWNIISENLLLALTLILLTIAYYYFEKGPDKGFIKKKRKKRFKK